MSIVALICARGGSKGLPGKNVRPLAGRPLIAWAVQAALDVKRARRVIVSTDSEEIASAARAAGAEVPFMRPSHLAEDTSSEWLVWRHALDFLHREEGEYPSALLVVPATAPLRATEDLHACLDEFGRGDADIVVTVTDAHRSPYFNMVRMRADASVELVIPPAGAIRRRQDAPAVYDMTTVAYVARPDFVMTRSGVFDGLARGVRVPADRALDIDTPLDFEVAEFLMDRRQRSAGR